MQSPHLTRFDRRLLAAAAWLAFAGSASAQNYTQTNLVSNQTGAAANTDANLVNGWGISRSASSPWWVSDNGTSVATLYNSSGTPNSLVVKVAGGPTGTVFNGTAGFVITGGSPAKFLFCSLNGAISGWNGGTAATVMATTPNAVYTGLAMATVNGNPQLYAADFAGGKIDVFDASFNLVSKPQPAFWLLSFLFGNLSFGPNPPGMSPFNIQNIGGTLFVAYAKPDPTTHQNAVGAGLGLIGAFTPTGQLIAWFQHVDELNAPWGFAMAPSEFGTFSHDLLVGQLGSGQILAFNPESGQYMGQLLNPAGAPIAIDGLWGIGFGNGGNAGPETTLFFAAGPNGQTNGLFGSLTAVTADLIQGNGN